MGEILIKRKLAFKQPETKMNKLKLVTLLSIFALSPAQILYMDYINAFLYTPSKQDFLNVAKSGDIKIIEQSISSGLDISAKDEDDNTALIKVKNKSGKTPIDLIFEKSKFAILELLAEFNL